MTLTRSILGIGDIITMSNEETKKFTLDPNLKAKWVDALKNGKYKQCKGRLKRKKSVTTPESYCCLGVLCDTIDPSQWSYDEGGFCRNFKGRDFIYDLPLGLIPAAPQNKLIEMNDDGKSFAEIADYIEQNL